MMNLLSFGIAPGNSILLFDVPSSMNQINKEACQQLYEALEALKQLKTLSLRYVETAATVLWMVWEYFAIQVCNLDFSPKKTEPSAYINHVLVFYILISWVTKDFQSKWLRFCPLLQLQSNYWRKLWQDLWDTYGRIIHARAWSTVMYAAVLQQTIQGSISLPFSSLNSLLVTRSLLSDSFLTDCRNNKIEGAASMRCSCIPLQTTAASGRENAKTRAEQRMHGKLKI